MSISNTITLNNIQKTYPDGAGGFTALKNVNVQFTSGEFVSIVGKSGSGKSTMLNMISSIDRPSQGEIFYNKDSLHDRKESELTAWRGKNIGIVFQFFQLLPTLTVLENVLLPMDFCNKIPTKERKSTALSLLKKVGIMEHAAKLPSELSCGQQQRAAIARALANDPPFIIADEPTGNLDTQNAQSIITLFKEMAKDGKGIVMVTHSPDLAECSDRIITIQDGTILTDKIKECSNES